VCACVLVSVAPGWSNGTPSGSGKWSFGNGSEQTGRYAVMAKDKGSEETYVAWKATDL
jgi:hypothetical protein